MDTQQVQYYKDMLHRNRLIPFTDKGKSIFTFSITDNTSEFYRDNPWQILEHNPNGRICYIEQYISDRKGSIPFRIWAMFKQEIKNRYPQVEWFYWVRYKDGQLQRYIYKIKEKELLCKQLEKNYT